jgi:hypothetical protein
VSGEPEQPGTDTVAGPTPQAALDLCQLLRRLLYHVITSGPARYRYQDDVNYRKLREMFLTSLRHEPCLAKFAPRADKLLPKELAQCVTIEARDWIDPDKGGQIQIIRLQSQLLSALERADRLPSVLGTSATPDACDSSVVGDLTTLRNRAQRRAEERRLQIRRLRAQGRSVKEIAREVSCSARTVYAALQDPR